MLYPAVVTIGAAFDKVNDTSGCYANKFGLSVGCPLKMHTTEDTCFRKGSFQHNPPLLIENVEMTSVVLSAQSACIKILKWVGAHFSNPAFLSMMARRASRRSDSTISATISNRPISGDHPSLSLALVASPSKVSTSVGR